MTTRSGRSVSHRYRRRIRRSRFTDAAPRALLAIAFVALLPIVTTCDRMKAKEAAPAGPPPPAVVVAEVTKKTVPIWAEFVAQTDSVQTVELRARIQGVLEHVRFEEGADVKKGQVLFEIQRTQYEASLQSARAQLAKAQAELARAQEQVEVQRSKAELEQRKAALAKAKLDVARLKPLAQAKAVPQVDLDNALAAEQVTVAGVSAAEAALKDTELNQRIGIQQAQAAVEAGRASRDPGPAGPRLHDHPGPGERHHRAARRGRGQPRRPGRANVARHDVHR